MFGHCALICRRRFFRLVHCAGSIFLPFCSPSCSSFFSVPGVARGGEAAKSECFAPDNNPVWIDASINPTGPRVSPSGHLSRRCHPAPDPKVSPLDTDQRPPPLDSAQGNCIPWTPAQRACCPLHSRQRCRPPPSVDNSGLHLCSRRSPRLGSCPCTLSGVSFLLVRSMRYFSGEHIPIGRSFFISRYIAV